MSDKGTRVLVIDDEPQIRKLLKVALSAHGFDLCEVITAEDGVNQATIFRPDLIILDLGLPDMDGKEVIRRIREWSPVPIIILSARDQEEEKVDGLDAGADDYLTKPFGVGELTARMRVLLRRVAHSQGEAVIACGGLRLDIAQRRLTVEGREVKLTPTEYDILKELMIHAGNVVTHRQLLRTVWGNSYNQDSHYIRVFVGQLRRKIEENPAQPRYIISDPGVGYRFVCNEKNEEESE